MSLMECSQSSKGVLITNCLRMELEVTKIAPDAYTSFQSFYLKEMAVRQVLAKAQNNGIVCRMCRRHLNAA